jgi:MFS family permease
MARTASQPAQLGPEPSRPAAVPAWHRGASILDSFRFRSYRFQWSSDSLMTWSSEMENLILGWYTLVQTDSALLLGLLGALRFLGTLVAPFFGVIADRVDRKRMIIALRSVFAASALLLMTLALTDSLQTWHVFVIATVSGITKVADNVARQALIADIVPARSLLNAVGLSRTTQDSAKIAGSLLGASLFASFGLGNAYIGVTAFYTGSVLLMLGITVAGLNEKKERENPLRTLKTGLVYMRRSPAIMAIMYLAFLVNLTVFPLTNGLMPVVARDVYGMDEDGLARLLAVAAAGALAASLGMAAFVRVRSPERVMTVTILVWHVLTLAFALVDTAALAYPLLAGIGMMGSVAMVAMSVLLMTITAKEFRGRVMGVRMLAVYGLPVGLLGGGALTDALGVQPTLILFSAGGLVMLFAALLVWPQLWRGVPAEDTAPATAP